MKLVLLLMGGAIVVGSSLFGAVCFTAPIDDDPLRRNLIAPARLPATEAAALVGWESYR